MKQANAANITRAGFIALAAGYASLLTQCTFASGNKTGDETSRSENSPAATSGTVRMYFCSAVTKGYGNGDCILLEYEGPDGGREFGLVDAGRRSATSDGDTSVVVDFLRARGVDHLDFMLLTHQHSDHVGDAAEVLASFPVNTLYVKHYDHSFSKGISQTAYERLLQAVLLNAASVVGIDPDAINPEGGFQASASPSMTEEFKEWIRAHPDCLTKCSDFNESNASFPFGNAAMAIHNWESYDVNGNVWDCRGAEAHEIVPSENNNSLGLVVEIGGRRAFLAGDMNNSDASGAIGVGDEDRSGDAIGEVDFFKLSHHGYNGSNTIALLNCILPKYVVCTNDAGFISGTTKNWLIDHGAAFEYSTADSTGLMVTLSHDGVSVDYMTRQRFVRKEREVTLLPEDGQPAGMPVEYYEVSRSVATWEELREAIEQNASTWSVDADRGIVVCEALSVDVSMLDGSEATSCIEIDTHQRIRVFSQGQSMIARSPSLVDEALVLLRGELTLEGGIVLDGNSASVSHCTSSLVHSESGVLVVAGAALQNNEKHYAQADYGRKKLRGCFGGAILSRGGVIELRDDTRLEANRCILDVSISEGGGYAWKCGGGAIAAFGSRLVVDGATIAINECASCVELAYDGSTQTTVVVLGGGILVENGCADDANGLVIEGNSTWDNPPATEGLPDSRYVSQLRGCGLYALRTTLCMRESSVVGNRCSATGESDCYGAGMYCEGETCALDGVQLVENSGARRGGGLGAKSVVVSMRDCDCSQNTAWERGGGIWITGENASRLAAENCTFTSNTASATGQLRGGAIWTYCPTCVVGTQFSRNAAEKGGAICSAGEIAVDGECSFFENTARKGSDLYVAPKETRYCSIDCETNSVLGPNATDVPLDEGPMIDHACYPRGPAADGFVIELDVSSVTGIARVSVDGDECLGSRRVVATSGTHSLETVDLAGRTASVEVDVAEL